MKTAKTTFNLKPLVLLLSAGLAVPAGAAPSPFAPIPLHLQNNSSVTSAGGVKPNVLLQIDNSTSMGNIVPGTVPPRNRLQVTLSALENLVTNPNFRDKVNWELIPLSDGYNGRPNDTTYRPLLNTIVDGSRTFGSPIDNNFINRIRNLRMIGGTPSTERYLDSLHVLRSALDHPQTYRCQKSYVVLFSDGQPTGYHVPMTNSGGNFFPTLPTTNSRVWYPGPRFQYRHPNHAAFVGAGGLLTNVNTWRPSADPNPNRYVAGHWVNHNNSLRYFAETVFNTDLKTTGLDAAGKSWNDPDVNNGQQTIGTFAIGFGVGGAYFDRAATSSNGTALRADNQAQLEAAFNQIFDQINSENQFTPTVSFASVAPALPTSETSKKVPNMAAAAYLDLPTGSTELRFYGVTGGTTVASTYTLPSFANRRALVRTGTGVHWFNAGTGWGGSNALFAIPASASGTNTDEWKDSMVPWLNRSQPDSAANKTGNALQYRDRATTPTNQRDMGDVIAAPVLPYGPDSNGRQKYLLTAANDGMVYLFQSSNDPAHPYDLKLNYIPAMMERESATDTMVTHFKDIVDPDYITSGDKPHQYMINGGMVVRSTDGNSIGNAHIFMAGNMGQGGRGTYALNIGGNQYRNASAPVGLDAPDSQWTSSVPLFETPKGAANVMGYTIGSPQIGRITTDRTVTYAAPTTPYAMTASRNDVKYTVFVGSGVRHPVALDNTESALYVYNALGQVNVGLPDAGGNLPPNSMNAGDLVGKIAVPTTLGRGGLAQPTLVDTDLDGIVDVVYAGDYSGGLYRFDLRQGNAANWTVTKIFQTQNNQPITAAPAVYRSAQNQYVVVFGTGSDLYQGDLNTTDIQSVYGIYDDVTVQNPVQISLGNLLQQNLSSASVQGGYEVRSLSDHAMNAATHKGWYFNLPARERVVVKPDLLLKTVVLTTRSYQVQTNNAGGNAVNDPCAVTTVSQQTSGEGWVMQFKADSGGNLPGGSDASAAEYAYIDFLQQNTSGDAKFRPADLYSSFKSMSGGIPSYALLVGAGDSSMIGGVGNAVTIYGDSGGTGQDPTLADPASRAFPRVCFVDNENKIFTSDSSGTVGVNQGVSIYGKQCTSGVRRLSWREIF